MLSWLLTLGPLSITAIFAGLTCAAMAAALLADRCDLIRAAIVLMAAWWGSMALCEQLGAGGAARWDLYIRVAACGFLAWIGRERRSWPILLITMLWVTEFGLDWIFFADRLSGTRFYMLANNLFLATRLGVVGAWGVWHAVSRRHVHRDAGADQRRDFAVVRAGGGPRWKTKAASGG